MVKVKHNLVGQRFGSLKVLYQTEDKICKNNKRRAVWHCLCDCGNEVDVVDYSLKNGDSKTCGKHKKFVDLTRMTFGRVTVIKYVGTDEKTGNALWKCKCKCGNIFICKGVQLTRTKGMKTCKICKVIDGKNDIPTFAP